MIHWRGTRMVLLRHDAPGDVASTYNDLMASGAAYGNQSTIARIGELARVIDVRMTPEGDVLILYEP